MTQYQCFSKVKPICLIFLRKKNVLYLSFEEVVEKLNLGFLGMEASNTLFIDIELQDMDYESFQNHKDRVMGRSVSIKTPISELRDCGLKTSSLKRKLKQIFNSSLLPIIVSSVEKLERKIEKEQES